MILLLTTFIGDDVHFAILVDTNLDQDVRHSILEVVVFELQTTTPHRTVQVNPFYW